jgi:hypothetical protein
MSETNVLQDCDKSLFTSLFYFAVHDVDTHMTSMRTMYTKAIQLPSGSAADKMTYRQKELKTLLSFLRRHVKPLKGISNLPRVESTDPQVEI